MKYGAIHIKLLLVKMQKRAVCIIMKVNRYYHTNLLFYDLRILKLEDLINLKTIMIMYNAKKLIITQEYSKLISHCTKSTLSDKTNRTFRT